MVLLEKFLYKNLMAKKYTVKNNFTSPQPGCHLPTRESLVSATSRLGTGKSLTFFYSVVFFLGLLKAFCFEKIPCFRSKFLLKFKPWAVRWEPLRSGCWPLGFHWDRQTRTRGRSDSRNLEITFKNCILLILVITETAIFFYFFKSVVNLFAIFEERYLVSGQWSKVKVGCKYWKKCWGEVLLYIDTLNILSTVYWVYRKENNILYIKGPPVERLECKRPILWSGGQYFGRRQAQLCTLLM